MSTCVLFNGPFAVGVPRLGIGAGAFSAGVRRIASRRLGEGTRVSMSEVLLPLTWIRLVEAASGRGQEKVPKCRRRVHPLIPTQLAASSPAASAPLLGKRRGFNTDLQGRAARSHAHGGTSHKVSKSFPNV